MKQFLLMIAVVALVGCGKKKEDGNTGVVNPNKPSPKAIPEKLIADPIVEKAIRQELKKLEGKLTEADLENVTHLHLMTPPQITDAGLKEVVKLQNLTELILDYTRIADAGLKEVANLQKLERLALSETKITDAGLKDIAKLQKLTKLDLDKTKITDAGLKEVAKLQRLVGLYLHSTQITDAGLKEVAKLKQLEELGLTGTQITDAGAAELRKVLPNCNITHSYKKD